MRRPAVGQHRAVAIVVSLLAVVAGFGLALGASRRAVTHLSALIAGTALPPFFVGITFAAIGTDLPEIANSVVSSAVGHGDLNVGDSIGSTVTQLTLVLGILPLVVGGFVLGRRRILVPGVLIASGLLVVGVLGADGRLSRLDGLQLAVLWIGASAVVRRFQPPAPEPALRVPQRHPLAHALAGLGSLGLVGLGAGAAVYGLVGIARASGVPELLVAFFGASIGTSLPELVFDLTAMRARARDLAVGDAVGSSLVDTTLSVGIGPLLFPVTVTARLTVLTTLSAAVAVALVVALLATREHHTRATGVLLVTLYLGFYPWLLG